MKRGYRRAEASASAIPGQGRNHFGQLSHDRLIFDAFGDRAHPSEWARLIVEATMAASSRLSVMPRTKLWSIWISARRTANLLEEEEAGAEVVEEMSMPRSAI